jgi:DNA-binding transcriptional LysR family regulator
MVAAGRGFAITTPLCVAEALLPMDKVSIRRLPGPQISRKLTLVARQRELGQLPRDIAGFSSAVLRKSL